MSHDDFEEFRSELDYKTVTLLVDAATGLMQIHHDGMSLYEALGVVHAASVLLQEDVISLAYGEEDEDEESVDEESEDEE